MRAYSEERRNAVLQKLLPPYNMTVAEVARQEGISEQTLYNWRRKIRDSGKPVPGKTSSSDAWSGEAKFAVVVETAAFSESELSQYCREKGLYPEQVKRWRKECLQGFEQSKEDRQRSRQQSKADKAQIKALKRELRQKEKALAETAALLVLRKKLNALWGEEDEGH